MASILSTVLIRFWLFLLVLLWILFSCSSLNSPDSKDTTGQNIGFQTIVQQRDFFQGDSVGNFIILSSKEQSQFLEQVPPRSGNTFPIYEGFPDSILLGIIREAMSGSDSVAIDSIQVVDDTLKVYSHLFHPVAGWTNIGYPTHFVCIPATKKHVEFMPTLIINEDGN